MFRTIRKAIRWLYRSAVTGRFISKEEFDRQSKTETVKERR